tara:strand:- start:45 stop:887 length:843 start_codon:yes stop_codon:yes gene_type:complete
LAILSIQSSVITGYVGNAAARLPLQRLGFEVWALDTVILSNHPAICPPTGQTNTPEQILNLFNGIDSLGLLSDCVGVLGGYLGHANNGPAMVHVVNKTRNKNKRTLFICDPVMGDNGKIYVDGDIVRFYVDSVMGLADIILPNAFEASLLTGTSVTSVSTALQAIQKLRNNGPAIAVITGVEAPDNSKLATLISFKDEVWQTITPKIEIQSHGAGDLLSALFTGYYIRSKNPLMSVSGAVAGVYAALKNAEETKSNTLSLVSVQEVINDPPETFPPERLR